MPSHPSLLHQSWPLWGAWRIRLQLAAYRAIKSPKHMSQARLTGLCFTVTFLPWKNFCGSSFV